METMVRPFIPMVPRRWGQVIPHRETLGRSQSRGGKGETWATVFVVVSVGGNE